ncbi:MAG: glycosyltransferase family 1 protein [Desulfovibrio sp.]|jgi:glycosyltransferase involved in cell wall biosynthesis|nr:glycosyltransferase family 1 protein [Desulfovibrio sp.]
MRTVFYVPPLKKMSGGLSNIFETARDIADLGGEVAFMGPEGSDLFAGEAGALSFLPWGSPLSSSDVWCVPESWPSALHPGLQSGAHILVYVQNWIFMLKDLPGGVSWARLPFSYLAVSRPVRLFLRLVHGLETADILPPAVDEVFFQSGARPVKRVRIAMMPRKNKLLGEQIRSIAEQRLARFCPPLPVDWVEIRNLPRAEVADLFRSCHIFLNAAFPEGFGLPSLEAMASGCVPLGFTGFGGWEYARPSVLPGQSAYAPPPGCIEPDPEAEPNPGNGFFFSDGDVLGAGLGLAEAVQLLCNDPAQWGRISACARDTALRYTRAARLETVRRIFCK